MNVLKNKSVVYFLLLVGLSFGVLIPFFHNGFFTMHDNTQVARVFEMFQSLKSGMVPVRWVENLGYGYGYPIFTFYAPLAYYFGAFWMFLGFDALVATKVMMIAGFVLAGIWMYMLAKDIWGEEGGFISALFYLLAPYHAVNTYVRGAVAELWGMAFLPLVFYGVWNTYKTGKWRYVFIGSLAFAGVILSHNLTAMMVTPFLLATIAGMKVKYLREGEYRKIFKLIVFLVLGIGLSSFYWLPAVGEMKYTNVVSQISGTGSKFTEHFVCSNQLWNSPWGYAGSAPGCVDGVSFRIGKLHVLAVLVVTILSGFIYKKNKEKGILILGCMIFFAFATFLTLQSSEFLWKAFSPMSYLQFPWRFLLIIVFFSSLLSGSVIWYVKELLSTRKYIFYGILFMSGVSLIVLYGKLFTPQMVTNVTNDELTNEKTIRFATSKISDEYLPPVFQVPKFEKDIVSSKAIILKGTGNIISQSSTAHTQRFELVANSPQLILLQTAPFPAWQAFLNGKKISYQNTKKGMLVSIPTGTHSLSLIYISTKLENIGNFVTLTSMLGLLVGIIYLHKKKML